MSIDIKNVSFSYNKKNVLGGISFSAADGDLVAVLGPNGVGKSTLFKCMLGFLKPQSGEIYLNEKPIHTLTHADIAKEIAYIPQSVSPAFNYTVLDTVMMGMTNQLGLLEMPGPKHKKKAMEALESLGIAHLAESGCNRISGGERQLMLLARSLVQNARILIMDEPTANLDYGNSFRVMERIQQLGDQGYTVIFSTHEPNQAFRYANRVLALKDGIVMTEGSPEENLTEDLLAKLYDIRVSVRNVDVGERSYNISVPIEDTKLR